MRFEILCHVLDLDNQRTDPRNAIKLVFLQENTKIP